MSDFIPPYLQPCKPRYIEDLIEICAMSAITHDQPRKVVARVFREQEEVVAFHAPRQIRLDQDCERILWENRWELYS